MTDRPIPPTRFAESRRQLAAWFGVSTVTVDNWTSQGCPALESTGRARRFDLLEVAKWRFGTSATPAPGTLDARTEAAALSRARRQEIEIRTAERCRELIPSEEFRTALGNALKQTAMVLESLPDILERDAGLDARSVGKAVDVIDRLREDLYARLTRES